MAGLFARPVLTVRIHAGFNAQVMLAGLLALSGSRFLCPGDLLASLFPGVPAELQLKKREVNGISGFACRIACGQELPHRSPAAIAGVYEKSSLSPAAREKAHAVWHRIAAAEAGVHGMSPDDVHFHEVGRMENIISIGLIAGIFCAINPLETIASPIPLGDGSVRCAHGVVPNPAPALLAMLDGVPVRPFGGEGEAVTPTGLGVLLGLGARFGPWPEMTVARHATAFLAKGYFEGAANGTLFALGFPA